MSIQQIVVVVKAWETDTVEIRWVLRDGAVWTQRLTIPPASTRLARTEGAD